MARGRDDDHDDQDAYTDEARQFIGHVYGRKRSTNDPQSALRAAVDELLAQVPELDSIGLATAVEWWLTDSGQRDFDTGDVPKRIAREAWAALAPAREAPKRRKRRRPARLQWLYAPLPLPILHDPDLSTRAKLLAAAIASTINTGGWNEHLETTASYERLAALSSMSRRSAVYAADELHRSGYVERKGRGRAGTRFRFTAKCQRNSAIRALFAEKEAERHAEILI